MSRHAAFRRVAVDPQYAQNLRNHTFPAPTRGIIMHENEAFMQPGGCIICDNWIPTMRGVKLRGGCIRHCVLPDAEPIISAFEYSDGDVEKMFAGQATKLYDVTATTPVLVKSGQTSGNYCASQMANASGNHMLVVNDIGNAVLHFDGVTWTTFDADQITGPPGSAVEHGYGLTYVWKYRNRFFFIGGGLMDAWYLDIDSHQGLLKKIPLAGSFTKGGRLLCGATWSVDAGDGLDDKCCFISTAGEVILFTGSNPGDLNNWRQEGRYSISPLMGMNAHTNIGGDLILLTVDGMVPLSQALTKSAGQLELAMLTRAIKPMWRDEVTAKRAYPWTIKKWDEQGIFLVTWPGGSAGNRYCAVANNATGAWARAVGWDAMCFIRLGGDLFFCTQNGIVMNANRTGYDDGVQYVATLVQGWETFGPPAAHQVWHQARAVFTSSFAQPFIPQLSASVNFVVTLPPPPPPGPDPGLLEVWDQGEWDNARWDQASAARAPLRNTLWQSIGKTGFAHAPICQITVAQQGTPNVELIAISAVYEPAGINVD